MKCGCARSPFSRPASPGHTAALEPSTSRTPESLGQHPEWQRHDADHGADDGADDSLPRPTGWAIALFGVGGDGEERGGEPGQGDVPVPGVVAADLVVVQA